MEFHVGLNYFDTELSLKYCVGYWPKILSDKPSLKGNLRAHQIFTTFTTHPALHLLKEHVFCKEIPFILTLKAVKPILSSVELSV